MHSDMRPVWEDLPASPCSAASDDSTMRVTRSSSQSSRPSLLKPCPPSVSLPDLSNASNFSLQQEPSSPTTKRARVESSNLQAAAGFIEATPNSKDPNADFVAKLNSNADEERRRFLLEKLQAIKSRKEALKSSPSGDDDVVLVAQKTNTKRKNTKPTARTTRKRKQAPRRRGAGSTRVPSKSPADVHQIINVDDDSPMSARRCGKNKNGSATKQPASHPTRQSSRVRRPRATIDEEPSSSSAPLPTCMSKCKRLQFCKRLVNTMLREPSSGPFSAPVKELWHEASIPRYFDVVKQPMDLRTVKKRLSTTEYIESVRDGVLPYRFDAEAFAHDVRLIFRNAMVYNRVGDMLYNCASNLQDDFNKKFSEGLPPPPSPEEITSKLSKKRSGGGRSRRGKPGSETYTTAMEENAEVVCVSSPSKEKTKISKQTRRKAIAAAREVIMFSDPDTMSRNEMRERLEYLERCRAPVLARTPVAKGAGYLTLAALLYEVEMSFEEKKRCGDGVTNVPPSKLPALLSIIQKSSQEAGCNPDDEVELDMDKLDNRTMRNIEAFLEHTLPNFKTVRSSSLGREFNCVEEVEQEINVLQERYGSCKRSSGPERKGRECQQVVDKPVSFFEERQNVSYSSSDSSSEGSDSESSDDSDCDTD
ncbi:unnamed protein product [Agarophyton chilense]|eukprot:gb/GEZJ01000078.1/.p1 GENE.gb/GEZJ01000078.1/~~gb/GEZJ01000078.1/.p1  ORF type:complete len:648 (-),score=95.29 gb/GEZJ01000078.1/:1537-3480(-)